MNKFLIVGLGNPGYRYTVHNMGSMLVEEHLKTIPHKKEKDLYVHKDFPIIYYGFDLSTMNISGEIIQKYMKAYNIKNLIVLYDDIRVKIGKYRIVFGGSHSGHNGIKSIINCRDNNFYRVAIGVGPKPSLINLGDFVLSKMPKEHLNTISHLHIWPEIYNIIYNSLTIS